MRKEINRRDFIKQSAAGTAAVTLAPGMSLPVDRKIFDPKGLPTRPLGHLGINVPLLGFGLGPRWLLAEEEESLEMLEYALDQGVFYWDTAAVYQMNDEFSEERIGKLLPKRRKEVFLVTKVMEREADAAKASIERSLNRLNTDYIDLMYVHNIRDKEDAESLGEKGKVMEVLDQYKSKGIIRHIGSTSHTVEGVKKAADLYDFEVMMISLNHSYLMEWIHIHDIPQQVEETAIPYAHKKGIAVVAMKVIRPRETIEGLSAEQLIRYALTYPEFSNAVISMQSMEELKENLSIIRDFRPMDREEMKEMSAMMEPFHRGENLAWMQPGYMDGGPGDHFMASPS